MSGDAFSFKGLVVSSLEFKDNDRILTVLTSDLGCISVIAKGVTKNNSKHAYLCMPFLLCDFTVTFSKGYYYLKEADIIQNNVGISSSLEATTVAFHISEIIKFASFDNIATADIYELTNYAFYHLSRVPDDYKLVYSAFNWRLLFLMGFNKIYDECDSCKTTVTDNSSEFFLDAEQNRLLCGNCIKAYAKEKYYRMSNGTIKALNYFIESDINRLFNAKADDSLLIFLMRFTTTIISFSLDRDFKTLNSLREIGVNV